MTMEEGINIVTYLKHSLERRQNKVNMEENFSILGKNFKTEGQRKISEAFHIERQKSTIDIQRLSNQYYCLSK